MDDLDFILDEEDDDLLRKDRWQHTRMDWNRHVAQLIHEDAFTTECHMSFQAWGRLSSILSVHLLRQQNMSRSFSPFTVNIIMGMGMRYIGGGGAIHNVRHTFGLSPSADYKCTRDFINGVLAAQELAIIFPQNSNRLGKGARWIQEAKPS